jgi:hypothetical protein
MKDLLKQAADLGTKAFHDGKDIAPALSAELNAMLAPFLKGTFEKPDRKGHKVAIALMKAYSRAWMVANIAAPVPGWTDEENAAFRKGVDALKKGGLK